MAGDNGIRRITVGSPLLATQPTPIGHHEAYVRFKMALEAIVLLDGANQGIAMESIAEAALEIGPVT